ncbi:MAG: energy transducer TonB [Bacteroidales bacterium]
MKTKLLLLVLIFSWTTGYAQTEKKAEQAALKCINKKLATAGKDVDYLQAAATEYETITTNMDAKKFDAQRQQVDSILAVSGFYKSAHLDIHLLKDCMLSAYDLNDENNDTSSTYYKLLKHITYLSDNPAILRDLSPALHFEALRLITKTDKQTSELSRVVSFILFQGIVKEFDHYAKSANTPDENTLAIAEQDQEQGMQIISIVDDDIAIEEEQPREDASPCGDQHFYIVEKMPEFEGGKKAVNKYLHVHSSKVQGVVYVRFLINCQGKVTNPKVIRGLTPLADKVALDLVKSMPDWIPGEQRGKKVNVQKTYPVTFN